MTRTLLPRPYRVSAAWLKSVHSIRKPCRGVSDAGKFRLERSCLKGNQGTQRIARKAGEAAWIKDGNEALKPREQPRADRKARPGRSAWAWLQKEQAQHQPHRAPDATARMMPGLPAHAA